MSNLFPARNVSPQSQEWAAAVERRINLLEGATVRTGGQVAQWAPVVGSAAALADRVDTALLLGQSAVSKTDDTITWSESRPLSPAEDGSVANPDVPTNPDATWFVYEGDRSNVKEVWRWRPPTLTDGDFYGEWVQQKWGTATLGEGAVDLANLSASLQGDLGAVAGLEGRLQAAEQSYAAFKADVEQTVSDLQSQVAGATGKVIVSPLEPQGADRAAGNLWVNTANGGSAPYAYNADTDQWFPVSDPKAVEAAAAAAQAVQRAQAALDRVQAAEDMAAAARLAATRAQETADGKNQVFYTAEKPSLSGRVQGDLWFDTDDAHKAYVYDASAQDFVALEIAAAADVRRVADAFRTVEADVMHAPYPPDGGVPGRSLWLSPDGKLFRKK